MEITTFLTFIMALAGVIVFALMSLGSLLALIGILWEKADCAVIAAILAMAFAFGTWVCWGSVKKNAPDYIGWDSSIPANVEK